MNEINHTVPTADVIDIGGKLYPKGSEGEALTGIKLPVSDIIDLTASTERVILIKQLVGLMKNRGVTDPEALTIIIAVGISEQHDSNEMFDAIMDRNVPEDMLALRNAGVIDIHVSTTTGEIALTLTKNKEDDNDGME